MSAIDILILLAAAFLLLYLLCRKSNEEQNGIVEEPREKKLIPVTKTKTVEADKAQTSDSIESVNSTVGTLVINPGEFIFPMSQKNETRSFTLKNDADEYVLVKITNSNPTGCAVEPDYAILQPKEAHCLRVTVKGYTDLVKNPCVLKVFCIPVIFKPAAKDDMTMGPTSRSLYTILNRKLDWTVEEVYFDFGKPPYLSVSRALELRGWMAPEVERPDDFSAALSVVRKKDAKNAPEPLILLPGDAKMNGDLAEFGPTTDEAGESEDDQDGEKRQVPQKELTNKRMLNEWVEFIIGDQFPDRRPVRALFRSLDTLPNENPDQFVALLYQHGEPIMGRAWNEDGKVAASFSKFGHDYRGSKIPGKIQILFELDTNLRGFDYDWRLYPEATSFDKPKSWHPVHVDSKGKGDTSPGVIELDNNKQILGNVDVRNERASYGYEDKENVLIGPAVHKVMVLCRKARPGCKLD